MPTRFWLKNIGNPSSISIVKPTIKKIGEKNKSRIKAITLLSIIKSVKRFH